MIIPDKLAFKYKKSFLFVNHTKKESISSDFSSSLILALVVGQRMFKAAQLVYKKITS